MPISRPNPLSIEIRMIEVIDLSQQQDKILTVQRFGNYKLLPIPSCSIKIIIALMLPFAGHINFCPLAVNGRCMLVGP